MAGYRVLPLAWQEARPGTERLRSLIETGEVVLKTKPAA